MRGVAGLRNRRVAKRRVPRRIIWGYWEKVIRKGRNDLRDLDDDARRGIERSGASNQAVTKASLVDSRKVISKQDLMSNVCM